MKALPERPHLGHLKKQAKALLDGVRRGDPESLERLRLALPAAARLDHAAIAAMPLRLCDAQSCVAREYGFDAWTQLKDHVELRAAAADAATRQRQWRRWVFGHGYQLAKPRLAERLLRDHSGLLAGEPALACAIGDVAVVQAADERHGYNDNVYGTLSFASIAETTPGGDWLACAGALVEAGSPLPAERYEFPEGIAAYFDERRRANG